MNKHFSWVVRSLLAVFLGLYLSAIFTNIISPKVQIFVDTEKVLVDNSVQLFMYDRDYIDVFPDETGIYRKELDINNKLYELEFEIQEDKLINCKINGKEFFDIEKISDYTTVNLYKDTYCLKINEVSDYHYLLFITMTIVWICILYYIIIKELFSETKYNFKMTYSNSAFKIIGRKPIIFSIIVTCVTCIIHYGCDLNTIAETIIIHQKGIDFYQLFAALNEYKDAELLMWQYDGTMLAGYNLISYLWYPALKFFDPAKYHLIQAIGYKLFNMMLYNLLVLSVISYLLDNGFVASEKAKKVYYWSIYNPITFYVSIIFIQCDMLPAYCITLGILLLQDMKKNKVLSATLIAFGISAKMPLLLFVPSIMLLLLFIVLQGKRDAFKQNMTYITTLVVLLMIVLLLPKLLNTPIAIAYSNLAQAERIYFTVIQYAPTVFLFVAIFGLIVLFILNYYNISLNIKKEHMIINTLYMLGAIALIFSFATLSTPSFYIQTIPAFVLLYSETEDHFQSFLMATFGVLIVAEYMFMPEGDITASLLFLGKEPIFTLIKNMMVEAGKEVRWISLIFTISRSAMFAYALIFANRARNVLKRGGELNNKIEL